MCSERKEPPNSSPLMLTRELWRGPLEAVGNFQGNSREGALPAVTPGWSFPTLFRTRVTHRTYHGTTGFQELFPEGWRQQGTPLASGMPSSPGTHRQRTGRSPCDCQSSRGPHRLSVQPLPATVNPQAGARPVSHVQSCQMLTCGDYATRHCARHVGSQHISARAGAPSQVSWRSSQGSPCSPTPSPVILWGRFGAMEQRRSPSCPGCLVGMGVRV